VLPLFVTVLAGNVVTAAMVATCLNTIDATALRRLHPAIAAAIADVPWADTTTLVWNLTRWRAALPAAVGLKSGAFGDADIVRLPPTLRSLDVSHSERLTQDVSFAHLPGLEVLDCSSADVAAADLPPSLRKLRMMWYSEVHKSADFSHLRALRVLECVGPLGIICPAAIASLPPSLEVLDLGCGFFDMTTCKWPVGGSLAHLTRLRVLRVVGIDAPALETFPPPLQSLDIGQCRITETASIAHLRCLRTLNASSSSIGDAVLATLPPSLASLNLDYYHRWRAGNLTSAAVFPPMPALRVLNVSGTGLGDAAVASIPRGLVELRMTNCGNMTQRASLDHLTALRVLHSSGTDLSPVAIASCRARGCAAPADGVVTIPTVGTVLLVVPLPAGLLVSCTHSGRVALWEAAHGGAPLAVTQIDYPRADLCVCALAALPDGHRVAIGVKIGSIKTAPSVVFVWDTHDAPQGAQAPVPVLTRPAIEITGRLTTVAALPNSHLVVGLTDGALCIVDVDAGAVLAALAGHTADVLALAVLPDARLASGSWDHTVRLWDVDARACMSTLAGHKGYVTSLVVLPDGRLASGSRDRTVRLWDVDRHVCVGVLKGFSSVLAVLPGSDRLGGMSYDDKLLVWDTRAAAGSDPTLTVELVGSGYDVTALVVLPGGRLATDGDGVRLWQLPLEAQAPR